MNRRFHLGTASSIEQGATRLLEGLRATSLTGLAPGEGLRWEVEVPDTDPLAWLNHHDNLVRMYCSNRERRLQIAALGVADMLRYNEGEHRLHEALAGVFDRLHRLPHGMRYYGGMRFSEDLVPGDSLWQRFGQVRFVLPMAELIRDEVSTRLSLNLIVTPDGARDLAVRAALLGSLQTPPSLSAAHLPLPVRRVNHPDRETWEVMVRQARHHMAGGALAKVVLARRCQFDFAEPLHPMALLQRLHEATPDSFHFCFNYGNEIAFIGATPERLYQRRGHQILSEALAGTRPRGASEEDDQWLESELMASAKERREHQLVADAVVSILNRFCTDVHADAAPEILKLRYVQHLRTVIRGTLKPGSTDADLLMALHPTPAVGGWPREAALPVIAALESCDRGWYSAPIGWITTEESEFAVAIRCALVEGSRLALFSGAGIMPESDTEQEWREIESKIGNFLRIFTT
ncbi:MAG TPA: isochorismate synthase [Kiritimatiellia bacterium]|nr:isochorismate synthase [Kiritimatiellia bacterium]HMP34240.1 isochorismate synthase [Kiritimatiellia bacterium]